MIGIVDYGVGNLRSVQKALQRVGADAQIIQTPQQIADARKLILPGVGAFGDAMKLLDQLRLIEPVRKYARSGRPFLGVCLGMQLIFDSSEEDGPVEGLGLLPGKVVKFRPADPTLKVPHMGWNCLDFNPAKPNALLAGLQPGCSVYFVHGYYAQPQEPSCIGTTTDYAGPFCSSVHSGNLYATQFHPEKSQTVGLKMLANFAAL
jgi:glutamine amidotransferase